ncbi:ER membrane protein complex subunit 4 [Vitis vinifera]|uniref:ER membrane protein complex subunit 4 n=1 Tax=Vitis vinifera TaxID=29760 RepID=A0A438KF29_VITVI|nr:ER membrane protein complex subunit 4 [Vitis vinifera]
MEKGKGVMGGRRWAVDLTDYSTTPSSRDIPDPPGFSRASLDQDDSTLSRQKKDAEANWKAQVEFEVGVRFVVMKDGTVNSVKNKLAQYVQYMKLSKLVQWLMVERVGEFKKAWEVAQAPFKNLLMMGFMMWMAGSTVHLFSIGITFSALWQPISALQGVGKVFEPYKDSKVDLLGPKLLFIALIWELNTLGLLPTHASDWVSSLPPAQSDMVKKLGWQMLGMGSLESYIKVWILWNILLSFGLSGVSMWLVKEIVHGYHGNFVDKKRKKVWRTTLLKRLSIQVGEFLCCNMPVCQSYPQRTSEVEGSSTVAEWELGCCPMAIPCISTMGNPEDSGLIIFLSWT